MRFTLRKSLHTARGRNTLYVDMEVKPGELVIITGPSGGGKTSLLRMIAGLMRPEQGRIEVGGEIWLDTRAGIHMPSQRRRVGMVFQEYALFPNMSVRENLSYALPRGKSADLIEELISIMEIEELVERYPQTLSGGQQQRVAVARSLVRRPRLMLLDEPLSALDLAMRSKLQDYILRVHKRYGLTTLMVSHDTGEIRKMGQRVLRLQDGVMIDEGPPAPYPGPSVVVQAQVLDCQPVEDRMEVCLQAGEVTLRLPVPREEGSRFRPGETVDIEILDGTFRLARP